MQEAQFRQKGITIGAASFHNLALGERDAADNRDRQVLP